MFDRVKIGRPAVMGILNVTPDSFSDGGRFLDTDVALHHGLELVGEGADLLDLGGESTRPGAEPVHAGEELARVVPAVTELAAASSVPLSVDTTKAVVAEAAVEAGASIVNDVSAGRFDTEMLSTVADLGAAYVVMHMRGEPRTMQDEPRYDDVVDDVAGFLAERLDLARAAGIRSGFLAADPGIGFGKTTEHNLTLLARLPELRARLGVPIVVGTSRKRFLGAVLRDIAGTSDEPGALEREEATLATVAWAVDRGADVVRVHDVAASARVVALARGAAA